MSPHVRPCISPIRPRCSVPQFVPVSGARCTRGCATTEVALCGATQWKGSPLSIDTATTTKRSIGFDDVYHCTSRCYVYVINNTRNPPTCYAMILIFVDPTGLFFLPQFLARHISITLRNAVRSASQSTVPTVARSTATSLFPALHSSCTSLNRFGSSVITPSN